MKYRKRVQNPQKSGASETEVGSVDIVHGFVGAEILFSELQARGVELSIDPSGGLVFKAPRGVMTDVIKERIRAQREDLLTLLERCDVVDHAFCNVDAPEEMPVGVECPWCRGRRLIDDPYGLRCWDCDRMAWVYVPGAIVRLDYPQSGFDNFPLTNNRGSSQ